MSIDKIVVIGGVACGPKVASRIKRLNPGADVTILEQGNLVSYAGCGLPYYISGEVKEKKELMTTPVGVVRDPTFFANVKDIQVMLHAKANKIDRTQKQVEVLNTQTGEIQQLNYDKLVIATGGQSFTPPIEGIDADGVFKLTHPDDAENIINVLSTGTIKQAVIIGAGLIGLEAAEALTKKGVQVTIIEKETQIMAQQYDFEISDFVSKYLVQTGIKLLKASAVTKFESDANGKLCRVHTRDQAVDAELALVSIGNKANVELASEAGLEISSLHTIAVNQYLQTSDPDIYAGGDCVANISRITGQDVFVPMGSTANKHGRVIANNICGIQEAFPGVSSTSICRVFEFNLTRTGLTEKAAREKGYDFVTVLSPSPDKPHFLDYAKLIMIKLIVEKGSRRILGCQIVGPGDVASRINVIVTAISAGMTVDQVANLDLAYAPPFSPAMDNIITAANIARNKLDGLARGYSPIEVKDKLAKQEDFVFLDVRSPQEVAEVRFPYDNVIYIPLGALRKRAAELPRDKEIICFCKISLRGFEAQRILDGLGFSNVHFLDGGVVGWPYEKRK